MKHTVTSIFLAGVLVAAAPPAEAKSAATPHGAVVRLFACLQANPCVDADVFIGHALREWQQIKQSIGKRVVLANPRLVASLPDPKEAAKWARHWTKAADELAKAGYNRVTLMRLGNGMGLIVIAPGIAVALIVFDMTMSGRQRAKKEYVILTLFQQKGGWRITFLEDSPRKHVEFLLKNKP